MSTHDITNLTTALYVVAAVLFILGIKRLSTPATARSGNAIAAAGMLLAVGITLIDRQIISYQWLSIGLIVGAMIGALFARTIKMTAMPQMVAVFNGFGGGASALVAAAEFLHLIEQGNVPEDVRVTVMFGTAIGALTLTGSFVAFAKLQGLISGQPLLIPARNFISLAVLLAIIGLAAWLIVVPDMPVVFVAMIAAALLFGLLLVIPIGGADMPVVISLLNSYSGIAAASAGFALSNNMLIIAGAIVGAAGLILTKIMTRAMNRSLANVMLGGFGATTADTHGSVTEERPYRTVTAEDAAMMLGYSSSVLFVPGYGLAVAQAQHAVKELADLLLKRGISVGYAIHPVAGRMPGHMNVLLAEADVPYDELYDLEQANPHFDRTDVAVVIGANDVTNPAARTQTDSPIFGMPILNVDRASSVIVLKRSMATGFSGIDNDLFYLKNTSMLFGDAKESVSSLVTEVRGLE